MSNINCLLCKNKCNTTDVISQLKLNNLRIKVQKWSGLDKFGNIYDSINWTDDPVNHYMHNSCFLTWSSKYNLEIALNRKKSFVSSNTRRSITANGPNDGESLGDTAETKKWLRSSYNYMISRNVFGAFQKKTWTSI